MKRWPFVASLVLFIALCVSLAYWALQLFKPPVRPIAIPTAPVQQEVHLDAAAALFGGRPTASTAVASNFQLMGVVMSGTPNESVAILSADGKPAQTVRFSKEVVPGVTVKEIHPRYVVLLDNGVSKRVELPDDAKGQPSAQTASPLGSGAPRSLETLGSAPAPNASNPAGMSGMPANTGAAPVMQMQASPESAPPPNPNPGNQPAR